MQYGGFWIRVVAYLIDAIILFVVSLPIALVLGEPIVDTSGTRGYRVTDMLGLIIAVAFFAGFESSTYQATPGKMAFGLIVTDANGGRITPGRAIGRYFAKFLSALILLIGFIMVAFTDRKQGLHDLVASTFVMKGTPGTAGVDVNVFE